MSKGKDMKPHIGIFGRRNNGKSSFINVLTGQDVAIVSDVAGTTTDPVKKSLEIFGIGPAIIVDTAGFDDEGELGNKRVAKSMEVLKWIDCALLIISGNEWDEPERKMIEALKKYEIPYLIIHNKNDLAPISEKTRQKISENSPSEVIDFCSLDSENLEEIINAIKRILPETSYTVTSIFEGLIRQKDLVVLVTPIDSEAPEGRMILPQVMAIRHALDGNCICVVVRETELDDFLTQSKMRPALVVTDSQAFSFVSNIVPEDIPLTGFSVLFARLKGDFEKYLEGTDAIAHLKDGDRVLILESCSHRVSCEDIGRFKIPSWIKERSGKQLEFEVVAGLDNTNLPITSYALVIQCGGCVFTRRQVLNRLKPAIEAGVPVSNYGLAIAHLNGIFDRAVQPLKPKQDEKSPEMVS